MEIPTINFGELEGEKRGETMALLHHACEKWGFFQIENHGIDKELLEKVKQFINNYYEEKLKDGFFKSDISKALENKENASNRDWESSFFVWHPPESNINNFADFSKDFRKTMEIYVDQLVKVAEKLSELMCENLGLEKDHIKKTFSGIKGPAVGTKVAKYPECPNPELVRGLREHTDAGGIILLLQDDQVPGLEFFKDGKWFKIPPSKNNTIFINTGDQIEVLSNGRYQSILHRVMTGKCGSRLSVATFYNPAGDAVISPAEKLLYPKNYSFKDYLKFYSSTKFSEKSGRFESMKNKENKEA
ncbi:1-aminocyclopropane-1-carboxylate oxidase 1-like [Chenopodium quinoa]|uniref:aminocyclopropanecarboxylate oxidase n=1 Tax=Chenopodium quinoa TaxID=63459 RepID=A0A803MDD9_CHEQI|nr:1-aminocyclopropane-1-carboxylate oxidase 1-like [Chenopodium quinoa]